MTEIPGIKELQREHKGLRRFAGDGAEVLCVLRGPVDVYLKNDGYPLVDETIVIEIQILKGYPRVPPVVFENGNKIPKTPEFHTNPDGQSSFCLGVPFELERELFHLKGDLLGFYNSQIEPYLYAVFLKLNHDIPFVFGEVEHGTLGIVNELKKQFKVNDIHGVVFGLKVLTDSPDIINSTRCICESGKRLKRCPCRLNKRIKDIGEGVSQETFQKILNSIYLHTKVR
ncbi:hypothetical protein [Thiomicrospira sp.]|uniref:hypothetical protein n=1 Tax=Thiomicrospira sp. TaxID=935 RepID=UPI002F925734